MISNSIDNNAVQLIAREMIDSIDKIVSDAPYDKTGEAIISEVLGDNKYKVSVFGSEYTLKTENDTLFKVNDRVRVLAPQNNYSLMHILNTGEDGKTVNINGVVSVNGKTGPQVVLTTADIQEGGANLYYTNARATANFEANLSQSSIFDLADSQAALDSKANVDYVDEKTAISAETGNIITRKTDGLYATGGAGGSVDSVNGQLPDDNKNVEVSREVTQAQYDALPYDVKMSGIEFYIKDGVPAPSPTEAAVLYAMYNRIYEGVNLEEKIRY